MVTNGKLGAIACPPQLIVTPPTDHTLHLWHYEADQLCVWKPGEDQLDQLHIRYTYVSTEGPAYKEHFGAKEHNYSHWLSLNHTAGWDLAQFLFVHPEAASSAKRDATPLRLLSWLSFRLEYALDGHQQLLSYSGLLVPEQRMQNGELFPLGRVWEGLIIDDYFIISAQPGHAPKEKSEAYRYLEKARKAYALHSLPGSPEKDVVAEEFFKAAGAEIRFITSNTAAEFGECWGAT